MGQKKFEENRIKNQEEISDSFSNNNSMSITIIESPTGSGKTYIDLLSAIKYRAKFYSSVIISTNTNKNAIDIKNTFLDKRFQSKYKDRFNLKDDDVIVEIGRSNYIDLDLLYETIKTTPSLFINTQITKEILLSSYTTDSVKQNFKNDVLMEDFIKEMGILEKDIPLFSSFTQDTDRTINYKEISTIFDAIMQNKIIVVNHAYLFILYTIYGNKNASKEFKALLHNTPVILDEFHSFFDSAKTILTKRFSLFRLKYSIDGILKHIEEDGNQTHIKRLRNIALLVHSAQKELQGVDNTELAIKEISELKNKIANITNLQSTDDKLNKIINITKNNELEKFIRLTKTELKELSIISFKDRKHIRVSFSPKGYPTIELANKIPSYEMNKKFWLKREAKTLCLSGTLKTTSSTTSDAYEWCIKRNGLLKSNIEEVSEYLNNKNDIDEDDKKIILENAKIFNETIDKIEYKTYHSLFPKENFLYTIIDCEDFNIPNFRANEEYENGINKWRENIGIFIANNLQYNSLVLSTSYVDTEKIGKKISELRKDIKVFIANENINMSQLVSQYKDAIDNNELCCLVGTEQYYTGLDLKDKYLHELYMAKIPFPPVKNLIGKVKMKGFEISKTENYMNEVVMKFTQGIGRAIRDYEDKAVLYILDGRINNPKQFGFKQIVDNKAIFIDYITLNTKAKKSLIAKDTKYDTSIYTIFFDYLLTMNKDEIEDILDLKKENINEINSAIKKILSEKITAKSVMEKEYFMDLIETKKYKNIWLLLLKIYSLGMMKKNKDIENEIRQNNMYGHDNLIDVAKHILILQ